MHENKKPDDEYQTVMLLTSEIDHDVMSGQLGPETRTTIIIDEQIIGRPMQITLE